LKRKEALEFREKYIKKGSSRTVVYSNPLKLDAQKKRGKTLLQDLSRPLSKSVRKEGGGGPWSNKRGVFGLFFVLNKR